MTPSPAARIVALRYHPIKGCHAVEAGAVSLTPRGVLHDREWMVVDATTRTFLSQRQRPEMACLRPRVESGQLVVMAPQMTEPLRVPAGPVREADPADHEATVWGATHPTMDEGDAAAGWLSAALKTPVRLVRAPADYARRPNPKYADPEERVAFQDGWPLLVTNVASLDDLNARLAVPVGMERFRPNVVVTGMAAWAEERWAALTVHTAAGPVRLRAVRPCARCAVTTIDQETGEPTGPEPLATLARTRRADDGKVNFGMNCTPPADGTPVLHVGDPVTAEFRDG